MQKLQASLADKGSLATVAHYLHVLEDACLVAGLRKYARHVIRQRAAPPKLVVLNNALLVAGAGGGAPDPARDPQRWGRFVENACIALAWNSGQEVFYWREEPHEVDFISEGSWGRLAVEVKTGAYTTHDLAGLLEFQRRHPDVSPLVLCDGGAESTALRIGLPALSWEDFLFHGPPSGPRISSAASQRNRNRVRKP